MGHEHNVRDLDARFKIDPVTKQIKNESKKKLILAQGDHNSEIYGFSCPRYIESHDMSLCNRVEVHFFNYDSQTKKVNSGKYTVEDLKVGEDESTIEFSWTISGNGTQLEGYTEFLIRFKCVDENNVVTYAWNTLFFSDVSVGRGSNVDELFETEYVDIIEQWKASVLQGFEDEFTEWKGKIETQVATDINKWKQEASEEVDDHFNSHSAEWNQKLAVERARIDQFTKLEEGSTTGDAELQDIRVGADGKTYESAGTAVRAQISNITDKLNKKTLTDNLFDSSELIAGYYVKATNPLSIRENEDIGYYETTDLKAGKTYVVSGENAHILLSCSNDAGENVLNSEFVVGDVFEIPNTASHIYINAWLACKDVLQIEEGTTTTEYKNYKSAFFFDGFLLTQPLIVDKHGKGMFETITDAVQVANDGDVIIVMPAIYDNEIIKAWEKTVHIIGISKKYCIIKNNSGDYYTPPIEICSGTLKNLSIIHEYNEERNPETKGYAIHIENDYMIGKNLLIENCYVESQWNFAVGMGLRSGCNVEFKDCVFVGNDETHGGLFFHDCNNENGIGEQKLFVRNCNIYSKGSGETTDLKIQSQQKDGSVVNVEFVNCNVRNVTNGNQKIAMLNSGTTPVNNIEELTNFQLSYGSCGNNSGLLNK